MSDTILVGIIGAVAGYLGNMLNSYLNRDKNKSEIVENMATTIGNLTDTVSELSKDIDQFRNAVHERDKRYMEEMKKVSDREVIVKEDMARLEKIVKDLIVGIDILTSQLQNEARIEPKWKRPTTGQLRLPARDCQLE